ncbi:hypothetical protein, partial [Dysosmobacter welbionis]|uniref:hypothetical protein n=1 Tax=Dysosmobacter welbionis TaxID=2093857 RepID=UPI00210AB0F5
TAPNQFFDLPLDYFLVQLYNLFGHGLLSPFRMVCRDFILPEGSKPCLFIFAKLILPYPPVFSFSDVSLSVGPFLCHGIRLLFNDTTYHRKKK